VSVACPYPLVLFVPQSLTRVHNRGDDDYFSSDLPAEKVAEFWGNIRSKVLILPSEKDEHVPEGIDVRSLIGKWMASCRPLIASELSGLIPGANHRVEQPDAQQWLAERVIGFLEEVVKANS
jgi:hypothetical protein